MTETTFAACTTRLLDDLIALAETTNSKSLDESSDAFFNLHINFFTKSYLVLMCAYLESYLKDVSFFYVEELNKVLTDSRIPNNLIRWSILKEKFDNKNGAEYSDHKLCVSRKDIDQEISPNPHRTVPFFTKLGIDLKSNPTFSELKESIEAIVRKRNNIVHHNDDASDVGLTDIRDFALKIKDYVAVLDIEIRNVLERT